LAETFSRKLTRAFNEFGQLCVGIDPHDELLAENGFEIDVSSLEAFSLKLLDQISDQAGIVKPQVSFFEKHGSKGFQVLENLLLEAQARSLLVIVDAKRGDIGSTMQAYTDAWLAKDAPFVCDAITLSPYLGVKSLTPAISVALERGKGIFVLSATSNAEARSLQSAKTASSSVSQLVIDEVIEFNQKLGLEKSAVGNIGVVIGATQGLSGFGLDFDSESENQRAPILAPGFGYQGANLAQAKMLFGKKANDVIYSISRSALRDGLNNVGKSIKADQSELKQALA
jgi:orotidine-5'-phosphate decarboxylase